MDDKDKTIQSLKERDKKLREAIEQLEYQYKKKREHATSGLHDIRVKLTHLKWAAHLLADNSETKNQERKEQLAAVKSSTAEALRMVEDLMRTLDDPA